MKTEPQHIPKEKPEAQRHGERALLRKAESDFVARVVLPLVAHVRKRVVHRLLPVVVLVVLLELATRLVHVARIGRRPLHGNRGGEPWTGW